MGFRAAEPPGSLCCQSFLFVVLAKEHLIHVHILELGIVGQLHKLHGLGHFGGRLQGAHVEAVQPAALPTGMIRSSSSGGSSPMAQALWGSR